MIAVEEVFDDWNREVLWSLRRRFRGTAEATLEDGAAFAWAQFAAKRPPDRYAVAWLKLVARREVLALLRRWERPVQMRADAASYDKPGEDHRSTWDRLAERDWLRAEHGTSDTLHDQL